MKYLTLALVISMGLFINGCSSKSNRYTTSEKTKPYWIKNLYVGELKKGKILGTVTLY